MASRTPRVNPRLSAHGGDFGMRRRGRSRSKSPCSRSVREKEGEGTGRNEAHLAARSDSKTQSSVKDARSSIQIINNEKRSIFTEFYVELVRMEVRYAFLWIIGLMAANVVVFWSIYVHWIGADTFVLESNHSAPPSKLQILLFSLATTTTLGVSNATPTATSALLIANIQAISVQMLLVFVTGVFFTRLSQTKPAIKAAKYALITTFNGQTALIARFVFDTLKDGLIDVRFALTYQRITKLKSGEFFYKFDNLELMRSEATRIRVASQMTHFITPESPLYGKSVEDLEREQAVVELTIFGCEQASMQPAVFRHEFVAAHGDIKKGYDFKKLLSVKILNGRRIVDHANLHELVPAKAKHDNDSS